MRQKSWLAAASLLCATALAAETPKDYRYYSNAYESIRAYDTERCSVPEASVAFNVSLDIADAAASPLFMKNKNVILASVSDFYARYGIPVLFDGSDGYPVTIHILAGEAVKNRIGQAHPDDVKLALSSSGMAYPDLGEGYIFILENYEELFSNSDDGEFVSWLADVFAHEIGHLGALPHRDTDLGVHCNLMTSEYNPGGLFNAYLIDDQVRQLRNFLAGGCVCELMTADGWKTYSAMESEARNTRSLLQCMSIARRSIDAVVSEPPPVP
jgi:hypothetical protein